jgi:antitoxin VapB
MTKTTVFQSGNSQAVRLPKEFRFTSKTVEIFRRGNEVVLRERPRTVGEMLDQAFADLPPLTEKDHAYMDAMLAAIKEPLPERERDWAALFGAAAPAGLKAARPKRRGGLTAAAKSKSRPRVDKAQAKTRAA